MQLFIEDRVIDCNESGPHVFGLFRELSAEELLDFHWDLVRRVRYNLNIEKYHILVDIVGFSATREILVEAWDNMASNAK